MQTISFDSNSFHVANCTPSMEYSISELEELSKLIKQWVGNTAATHQPGFLQSAVFPRWLSDEVSDFTIGIHQHNHPPYM